MENWGLITYRETSILYDAEETSVAAHQWVAVVVAHELAHQVRNQTKFTNIRILVKKEYDNINTNRRIKITH